MEDASNAVGRGRIEDLLCRNENLSRQVEELNARLDAALAELEEKERRLREGDELFRITFEKAAVGMAHVAPDGRWLRVNEKLCEVVGYGCEELLGLTFEDITHPADLEADLRYVRRMLKGDIRTYSMEKRYVKKDGSRVWICLSVSLVRDPSGEPSHFISVVEDITERKLSELVPDPLTEREMEVLGLIVEGRTNWQIASELNYSEATVKLHVGRILAKLGVDKRTRAAERAVEIGLLPPPTSQSRGKVSKRLGNISRFGVPLSNGGQ